MSAVQILQTSPFAYEELDTETRIVVQQRTSELKTLIRRSAADIIEIGSKLIDVRQRLGPRRFAPWLQAELGWSDNTAYRFILVHERFGDSIGPNLGLIAPSALYLLAAPSTPEEARQEALDRAAAGEHITVKTAQTLIADRKPAPAPAAAPDPAAPTPIPEKTVSAYPLPSVAFATPQALMDGLVQWLTSVSPGETATQRVILYNIEAATLVGQQRLEELQRYIGLPRPFQRADLLAAVSRLYAAMKATNEAERTTSAVGATLAVARSTAGSQGTVVPPPHTYGYTGAELPEGVRAWLHDRFPDDEDTWPEILQRIITDRHNGAQPLWNSLYHSRRLYSHTPSELLAAAKTLYAELAATEGSPLQGTGSVAAEPVPENDTDEVAGDYAPIYALEGGIHTWLGAFPVPDRLPLMQAIKDAHTHHPQFLALAGATPSPRRIGDIYQAINNVTDQLQQATKQAAERAATAGSLRSGLELITVDRPAAPGDTVIVDAFGHIGAATVMDNRDWELVLRTDDGSWQTDLFGHIIGLAAGEKTTFIMVYPYSIPLGFKGQTATFQVTIKAVRTLAPASTPAPHPDDSPYALAMTAMQRARTHLVALQKQIGINGELEGALQALDLALDVLASA